MMYIRGAHFVTEGDIVKLLFDQFMNMESTRRMNCRRFDYVELLLESLDKHMEEEGGSSSPS